MTNSTTTDKASLAIRIAHEDLRVGDFVTVLNELIEFPSFLWCDADSSVRGELVRLRFCAQESGMPLKIRAICLPFLYVRSPYGWAQTIDVRQVELVRLKTHYAKTIWKDLRKQRANLKRRK